MIKVDEVWQKRRGKNIKLVWYFLPEISPSLNKKFLNNFAGRSGVEGKQAISNLTSCPYYNVKLS